jgi:predicted DNA-binding transcriptional regulator AlpA
MIASATRTAHNSKLLTIEQTQEMVDLSRETIRRWSETGQFPKPRHQRKNYTRFHLDDILAWIDGNWTPNTPGKQNAS